jgi:hypothetical protein
MNRPADRAPGEGDCGGFALLELNPVNWLEKPLREYAGAVSGESTGSAHCTWF